MSADSGATWTEKTFSGSGAGSVTDIHFVTDSEVVLSHITAAPLGRILRSYDGGYSWVVMPEGVASLDLQEGLKSVVGCKYDPNLVLAAGVATGGTDGIILRGVD